jgi:hypothetical protein
MRKRSGIPKLGPMRIIGNIVLRSAECECGTSTTYRTAYQERGQMKAENERTFRAHIRSEHAPIGSDLWKAAL